MNGESNETSTMMMTTMKFKMKVLMFNFTNRVKVVDGGWLSE